MNHNLARTALAASLAAACLGAAAETRLERGPYRVESIAGCGNWHTPQGPDGPLPGKPLAGGQPIQDEAFTATSANITPDRETGIGKWTDAQIAPAWGPAVDQYRSISDNDLAAMVAYLRKLPPE